MKDNIDYGKFLTKSDLQISDEEASKIMDYIKNCSEYIKWCSKEINTDMQSLTLKLYFKKPENGLIFRANLKGNNSLLVMSTDEPDINLTIYHSKGVIEGDDTLKEYTLWSCYLRSSVMVRPYRKKNFNQLHLDNCYVYGPDVIKDICIPIKDGIQKFSDLIYNKYYA